MYDSIVVGCGFAGAVVARELAEKGGQQVCLLEKRNHIGGNCYDIEDEHGILIHKYGPHIFHTNNEKVFAYLSRFTEWYLFRHEVVANVHGEYLPIPFNLNTLVQVYGSKKGTELEAKLIEAYGEETKVPILKLKEHPDQDIAQIADFVYENVFLQYTLKQWGQKPEDIDPAVTARVPVNISRDNSYFADKYQGMPLNGYTSLFEKILDYPGIKLELGTDAKSRLRLKDGVIYFDGEPFAGNVIFTGPLDEFFACSYGQLPYRSLDFIFEHHLIDSYQPKSVVNYTVSEAYTRITEFKKLTGQVIENKTTIVKEYPVAYENAETQIPYYAINNPVNDSLYQQYCELLKEYPKFYLLGRLAEYKYYNIDAIVDKALVLAEQILQKGIL